MSDRRWTTYVCPECGRDGPQMSACVHRRDDGVNVAHWREKIEAVAASGYEQWRDRALKAESQRTNLRERIYAAEVIVSDEDRPDHDGFRNDLAYSMTPAQAAYAARLRGALQRIGEALGAQP